MALLGETSSGNRTHIAFFGLRNAGKSTLVNAFCRQEVAIVNATPGTTTDPVSKAMEILPLGPCLITDTAGLDDEGELGSQRVKKSLAVLDSADVAVWVDADAKESGELKQRFLERCRDRGTVVLEYRRGDAVDELRRKIAALEIAEAPKLLEGMVEKGSRVILVCPIDEAAPKGRLILPQVEVLRECLDRHLVTMVVEPEELADGLATLGDGKALVITDSQAFGAVKAAIAQIEGAADRLTLTSFSILFARQKGDLAEFERALARAKTLRDGDRVLIAEACTHHRQCNDIGTTKIPQALKRLSGAELNFTFSSGNDFSVGDYALIVHCGGCMLTRRAMLARIETAKAAGVPIVNYGLLLNAAHSGPLA